MWLQEVRPLDGCPASAEAPWLTVGLCPHRKKSSKSNCFQCVECTKCHSSAGQHTAEHPFALRTAWLPGSCERNTITGVASLGRDQNSKCALLFHCCEVKNYMSNHYKPRANWSVCACTMWILPCTLLHAWQAVSLAQQTMSTPKPNELSLQKWPSA